MEDEEMRFFFFFFRGTGKNYGKNPMQVIRSNSSE